MRQKSYDYVKGTIKLLWSAPAINGSPIKNYTVLRDVGSGIFYPLWSGAETSFIDTNLVEGKSYNYKIYASNAAGDGPVSQPKVGYAGEIPGIIRQDQLYITKRSLTELSIAYD